MSQPSSLCWFVLLVGGLCCSGCDSSDSPSNQRADASQGHADAAHGDHDAQAPSGERDAAAAAELDARVEVDGGAGAGGKASFEATVDGAKRTSDDGEVLYRVVSGAGVHQIIATGHGTWGSMNVTLTQATSKPFSPGTYDCKVGYSEAMPMVLTFGSGNDCQAELVMASAVGEKITGTFTATVSELFGTAAMREITEGSFEGSLVADDAGK